MPHQNHRRALIDLVEASGSPLTTSELARMIGVSTTFIRTEIKCGELRAVAIGRGRKCVYRITTGEAFKYARRLGLL